MPPVLSLALALLALPALALPALAAADRPAADLPAAALPPIVAANCPPGLAKKNPPCLPPGQARRQGYSVGDRYEGDWRVIDQNRYGLPPLRDGEAYIRVGDQVLRVNRTERLIIDIATLVLN